MKPTKEQLKKLLTPIVESIINEREYEPSKPTIVKPLGKLLEMYGLVDIIYTAKLWYEKDGDGPASRLCDEFLAKANQAFKGGW